MRGHGQVSIKFNQVHIRTPSLPWCRWSSWTETGAGGPPTWSRSSWAPCRPGWWGTTAARCRRQSAGASQTWLVGRSGGRVSECENDLPKGRLCDLLQRGDQNQQEQKSIPRKQLFYSDFFFSLFTCLMAQVLSQFIISRLIKWHLWTSFKRCLFYTWPNKDQEEHYRIPENLAPHVIGSSSENKKSKVIRQKHLPPTALFCTLAPRSHVCFFPRKRERKESIYRFSLTELTSIGHSTTYHSMYVRRSSVSQRGKPKVWDSRM